MLKLRLAIVLAVVLPGCAGEPARPKPPYSKFEGSSFEPSAVAYDPATDRYLVLNDQDGLLYRYKLVKGKLELPRGERHREIQMPDGSTPIKFESITRLEDGTFLAMTAYDRWEPDFCHFVKFRFVLKGTIQAEKVSWDDATVTRRLQAVDPTIKYWKIEGLSTTAGDRAVVLAVRSVGLSYMNKRDVVWLVRLPRREDGGYGGPDRLVRYDAQATVGREEGASSLERNPTTGNYYLLTSYEDEEHEDTIGAHSGHLFVLPAADVEGPAGPDPAERPLPPPLRALKAKCEGLAVEPSGRVLVCFDDDKPWKKVFSGYEQNEGLFVVFEPGELEPVKK